MLRSPGLSACHFLVIFPEKLFCSDTFKKHAFLDTLFFIQENPKNSKDNFPKLLFVSCYHSFPSFWNTTHFWAYVCHVSCKLLGRWLSLHLLFVLHQPLFCRYSGAGHCTGNDTWVITQLQLDKQYNDSLKISLLICLSSYLFQQSMTILFHYYNTSTITLCLISSF